MPGLFVTGAGTAVGKTLVTAILAHQLAAAGRAVTALKPLATGFDPARPEDSDAAVLLAALGEPVTPDAVAAISPFRHTAALSPDMAAAREGGAVDVDGLIGWTRAALSLPGRVVLVEGIGGAMVPLGGRLTVRDWIAALGIPALVVGGSYLGALSHMLTAVEALRSVGVALAAVVVSESADSTVGLDETCASLGRHLACPVIALPRLPAGPAPWTMAPPVVKYLSL